MYQCNSDNKVVLTYINAVVGFLRQIVASLYRYIQDQIHCCLHNCTKESSN